MPTRGKIMKWYEISKVRPPHGELIWVWDKTNQNKFLIRYMGSDESWISCKDNDNFPIWAYLNDQPERLSGLESEMTIRQSEPDNERSGD